MVWNIPVLCDSSCAPYGYATPLLFPMQTLVKLRRESRSILRAALFDAVGRLAGAGRANAVYYRHDGARRFC